MKKTLVSIAAASLIVTSAMAADKGIDIVTTGQAVVYYQTASNNGYSDTAGEQFDQESSKANAGVQLNLAADLKNNFTFGSQLTYLGTAGLEKNVVVNTVQNSNSAGSAVNADTTNSIALTKIFIAKKIANSTVKIGRQELPKSLSPFAFSEGWSVFKNTFDAVLFVNSDIPDTTLVGAYVSGGTGMSLGTTGNLTPAVGGLASPAAATVDGTAYMLTVQNKSVPMTTITATYYDVAQVNVDANASDATTSIDVTTGGASAIWLDAKVADKSLPMGLKIGLQAGQLSSDYSGISDTTAMGAKVSIKAIDALSLAAAYTSVDGDDNKMNIAVKNFGTGTKTPLYTQMIANQNAIALDGDTFMLKAAYNTGDYGTITAQGTMTTAGKSNIMGSENDYTDLELVYKVKAAGVTYLAAYVNQTWEDKDSDNMDSNNIVRLWARYNF